MFPLCKKGMRLFCRPCRFGDACLHFHPIFQVFKTQVVWFLLSVSVCFLCSEKAPLTISAQEDVKIVYYRALYPFESRSHDEITIQPGDIVMVSRNWDIPWQISALSFCQGCLQFAVARKETANPKNLLAGVLLENNFKFFRDVSVDCVKFWSKVCFCLSKF